MSHKSFIITQYQNGLFMGIAEQSKLHSAFYEKKGSESLVGNIYIATVVDIVKNIDAAFVEIAPGKKVFVPLGDPQAFITTNRHFDGHLKQQDTILVQIEKDAVKTKDPCGTGKISLAGYYCAVSLEQPGVAVSKKLEPIERKQLKEKVHAYLQEKYPFALTEYGIIIRTNAREALLKDNIEPVLSEIADLVFRIHTIVANAPARTTHSCMLRRESTYMEMIRKGVINQVDQIVTDQRAVFEELEDAFSKDCIALEKLKFYEDERISLANIYSLNTRIEEMLGRKVWLPSGGNLVIDELEAMTVIDVNSAKISSNKSREDLFFQINMEAAEEIAHQLILRNLAGIIMVDFINMEKKVHEELLMKRLQELLRMDPTPTRLVDITPLGIVEITRKRQQKSFREQIGQYSLNK